MQNERKWWGTNMFGIDANVLNACLVALTDYLRERAQDARDIRAMRDETLQNQREALEGIRKGLQMMGHDKQDPPAGSA